MITHLISTTEFVKLVTTNGYCNEGGLSDIQLIKNYVNFVSQKPELWMFVPCDEDGEPFVFSTYDDAVLSITGQNIEDWDGKEERVEVEEQWKQYQQAQSKVLFKGWAVEYVDNNEVEIRNNRFYLLFLNGKTTGTLEVCIGEELTETALKQIL